MRLFLASQDFGGHADRLRELVGNNRKALVVFNARDDQSDNGLAEQKELFEKGGFEFTPLDLRGYFGKPQELREFINEFKPGQINLLGGNTFTLRRALYQSGLDEILKTDIYAGRYVYAGHSAGAIVAGSNLNRDYDSAEYVVPEGYRKVIIWDALGFIPEQIIPHYDSVNPRTRQLNQANEKLFRELDLPYVVLNDSDVLVVDGAKKEILR